MHHSHDTHTHSAHNKCTFFCLFLFCVCLYTHYLTSVILSFPAFMINCFCFAFTLTSIVISHVCVFCCVFSDPPWFFPSRLINWCSGRLLQQSYRGGAGGNALQQQPAQPQPQVRAYPANNFSKSSEIRYFSPLSLLSPPPSLLSPSLLSLPSSTEAIQTLPCRKYTLLGKWFKEVSFHI